MEEDKSLVDGSKDSILKNKTNLSRKEGRYELPKFEEDVSCPACNSEKSFSLKRTIYRLPDGDDILILLMECNKCNFKNRDLLNLYTSFKPGVYRLHVKDGDFSHKVFRGSSGELVIEEIGIEIERGEAARFEYTNVEGILMRIEEQLEFFLSSTPTDTKSWMNANEAKKRLKKCMIGEMDFTVVLKDPQGGSYIAPTQPDLMEFIPYQKNS